MPKFVESGNRGRCIGGASRQSGGNWNPLLESNGRSGLAGASRTQQACGTVYQISWSRGKTGLFAFQPDLSGWLIFELERVIQAHRHQERFDFVVAVGTSRKDFQIEIHLGRRPSYHGICMPFD